LRFRAKGVGCRVWGLGIRDQRKILAIASGSRAREAEHVVPRTRVLGPYLLAAMEFRV
jgi:hypothetical protein